MKKRGNPNGTANLKHFKKGKDERRNLAGAPKKLPQLDVLLGDLLAVPDKTDGITGAQRILSALYDKAMLGDTRAAELLMDRGWGKVKQDIGLGLGAGVALVINVLRGEKDNNTIDIDHEQPGQQLKLLDGDE